MIFSRDVTLTPLLLSFSLCLHKRMFPFANVLLFANNTNVFFFFKISSPPVSFCNQIFKPPLCINLMSLNDFLQKRSSIFHPYSLGSSALRRVVIIVEDLTFYYRYTISLSLSLFFKHITSMLLLRRSSKSWTF